MSRLFLKLIWGSMREGLLEEDGPAEGTTGPNSALVSFALFFNSVKVTDMEVMPSHLMARRLSYRRISTRLSPKPHPGSKGPHFGCFIFSPEQDWIRWSVCS